MVQRGLACITKPDPDDDDDDGDDDLDYDPQPERERSASVCTVRQFTGNEPPRPRTAICSACLEWKASRDAFFDFSFEATFLTRWEKEVARHLREAAVVRLLMQEADRDAHFLYGLDKIEDEILVRMERAAPRKDVEIRVLKKWRTTLKREDVIHMVQERRRLGLDFPHAPGSVVL